MSNPVYMNYSPAPNFIGALVDAPVYFRVEDYSGLNVSTLQVVLNGIPAIVNGVFQSGFAGAITQEDHIPNALAVVVTHTVNFQYSSQIVVNLVIKNLLGTSGAANYSFVTLMNPDVEPPLVSAKPHGDLFNHSVNVQLLTDDVGGLIFYTLDGSMPDLSSALYTTPLMISDSRVLKFIAVDSAFNYSPVIVEKYVIDVEAPITQVSVPGGSYFVEQILELKCNDPEAKIYYSIDGSIPSVLYVGPIETKKNFVTTLKFFSVDRAGNAESIKTEVYTIEIAKNNFLVTNLFVTCPFNQSELFLTWDDMNPIYRDVMGYNVYRADVEMGPYKKLNTSVLGITQYIDKTLDTEIVSEDVSEQFKRTVSVSKQVNDDFKKVGEFDRTKWRESDEAQMLFQYAGVIFKDAVGLKNESKITSTFKLRGDFDIMLNFGLTLWNAPTKGIQSSIFRVRREDDYIQIERDHSHTLDVYSSNQYVHGNPDLPSTLATSDLTGAYRIVRVGKVVSTYFWNYKSVNTDILDYISPVTYQLLNLPIAGVPDVDFKVLKDNITLTFHVPLVVASVSSLNIITGPLSLIVAAGLDIVANDSIEIRQNVANYMTGIVIAYDSLSGQLDVQVMSAFGSGGPYVGWAVSVCPQESYTINMATGEVKLSEPVLIDMHGAAINVLSIQYNEFEKLASFDDFDEDVNVEIVGKSANSSVEMKWSDFKVVSGHPIIVEPLSVKRKYIFATKQRPIVDSTGKNKPTDNAEEIFVTIDGKKAYVKLLQGIEGVVELETDRVWDPVKKSFFEPPKPNEFSKVIITYKTPLHHTSIRLRKNYFYKVSCVTNEDETDLDLISCESVKPEKMTYIFEEAVRRNAWLLDNGGEHVLLFIKKKAGKLCHCVQRDLKQRVSKRADQNCPTCFGSDFEGGFDGPYPIIIGPLTTEQRVMQTDRGLKLMYQIETWIGPSPIVNQRDMIVRRNGDRCLLGPITPVEGPGGVRVQQHFTLEILDGTDIRYTYNILPLSDQKQQPGVDKSSRSTLRKDYNVAAIESPKETTELITSIDKTTDENKNVDHIVRGRSLTFENTNY